MAEYIDGEGYERGKVNHSDLIHRQVAYHEIYLKNREKYPLPFSKYVVHHKDKNKRNNRVSNLEILTEKQHNIIHGIIKPTHEEEVNWGKNKKHYDEVVKQHNNPPQEVKEEPPVEEERPEDWIEIHPPETKEPVRCPEPVKKKILKKFLTKPKKFLKRLICLMI